MTIDQTVEFSESEGLTIIGDSTASPYNEVITFTESEGLTIVGDPPRSPYEQVIVFDDSEAMTIIGQPPASSYDQVTADSAADRTPDPGRVVVFSEAEVEPIIGMVRPSPYQRVITFSDAEAAVITGDRQPSPYRRVITFDESEALQITAAPVARQHGPALSPGSAPTQGDLWEAAREVARRAANPTITTTGPSDRPAWWPRATGGISFELQDAWLLPPPEGVRTELPLPQTQVLSWLQRHAAEIVAAEKRFNVDRRAIAGAIAWEALENPRTVSVRAVGPGKVHTNAPVVNEVELAGYLPRRTAAERAVLLKDPAHAITYIAAIMSAKSAIAEAFGFQMRRRPDLLTNEYVARSLSEWTERLATRPAGDLVAAEDMALWTRTHLLYLERGVGRPER